jgi:sugar lactone lactonase YvrE
VFVCQDGILWNAPTVFDQLIHEKAMPVTVGIFISSGNVPTASNGPMRINRSFEYDSLGNNYASFLLDEFLPHVVRTDKLNLSTEGNDRCIAGLSSGGLCAFNAAWERPDAFRRVFSAVGSFASFRGGNAFPVLIRMVEPKPIRVFLQDGNKDLNIFGGDWWLANQEMESALKFAGYEVEHAWGTGGHDPQHATEVFPHAMRWLWKDWPAPIKAGAGSVHHRDILLADEPWEPAAKGYRGATAPAANAQGEVFFNDTPAGKTYKIGLDGKVTLFLADSKGGRGLAFGPDGRLYAAAAGAGQVIAYDSQGRAQVIAENIRGYGVVVGHNGGIYVTEPGANDPKGSRVWFIGRSREKKLVDTGLTYATGVAFSCDQAFLSVADSRTHWVYNYEIRSDGSLANRQSFDYLHVPDNADDSGAEGICTDSDGRRYVATRMGIQVCSREGRVTCIIPVPCGRISGLCFGGANFDTLFAACGDMVYRRKVKVRGACPFQPPVNGTPDKL